MTIEDTMRNDWNQRAKENAYFWVESSNKSWKKEDYNRRGEH